MPWGGARSSGGRSGGGGASGSFSAPATAHGGSSVSSRPVAPAQSVAPIRVPSPSAVAKKVAAVGRTVTHSAFQAVKTAFTTAKAGAAIVACPLAKVVAAAHSKAAALWAKGQPKPMEKLKAEDIPLKAKRGYEKTLREAAVTKYIGTPAKKVFTVPKKGAPKKNVGYIKPKLEKSVGVNKVWTGGEGAAKQWGGDNAHVQAGKYGWNVSSGYTHSKEGHKLNVISASASASAGSAHAKGSAFHDRLTGQASVDVLSAEIHAGIGGEWSKKAKEVHAKVGVSVDLVKAEASGSFKFRIPFTNHHMTVGGGLEGQVGASAEASLVAGKSASKGWQFGFKAKAGLGLGGGFNFNIGFL